MDGVRKRPRLDETGKGSKEAKSALVLKALGIAIDEEPQKDDTELRLESILFSKPYTPEIKPQPKSSEVKDEENGYSDVGEHFTTGLEDLRNEDIFVMDDIDMPEGNAQEDGASEPSDSTDSSEHRAESNELQVLASASIPKPTYVASQTKSAWTDPSDEHVRISLADDNRLRKLRDSLEEDEISGKTYEGKLRRLFERINPTPEWAINARTKLHKKRKLSSTVGPDESNQGVEELLRSTSGLLKGSSKHLTLPRDELAIERLRDANGSAPTEGSILSLRFHPATTVSVMLTSGSDRRLRLFNIDGLTNPLLQTVHVPELRMPRAIFHPTGSSIFLSGRGPFYYTYDIQTGRVARSHRGLLEGIQAGRQNGRDIEISSLEISKFSADGKILAVGGKHGYIHLVDWAGNLGGGQIIGSMKMNAPIKDLCWVGGGDKLMAISIDSEVYLWDVGSRRCISKRKDNAAFSPNLLEGSAKGDYYAIGTSTGIVSVYDHSIASPHDGLKTSINPLKEITNMTTSITSLQIDASSQIIAVASQTKRDQLKLIHLPSLTVFSNWPTSKTPLGTVTAVDFSPRSEYIGIGNRQGRALLYTLKHFSAQE